MNFKQLSILVLCFLSFGCQNNNSEEPPNTIKSSDQGLVSASELLTVYINNRTEGDKLFNDKEVIISGQVWDVSKDRQRLILEYRDGQGYGILCASKVSLLFTDVKVGDNVRIRGMCKGMRDKFVNISDCIVY